MTAKRLWIFNEREMKVLSTLDVSVERAERLLLDSGFNCSRDARAALGKALPYHVAMLSRIDLLEAADDNRKLQAMGDSL